MVPQPIPIYELAISIRTIWQAHSLSNAGSNGTNRTFPRRQLLADGTETDACSGNIAKHHHAVLLAEKLEALDIALCQACSNRDGRRAAALSGDAANDLDMASILKCGLCDAHGFLVTAKKGRGNGEKGRDRLSKHSLVEFSFALAIPDSWQETPQIFTRMGTNSEDQMIMKKSSRSGIYAQCVRYKSVGIGVDTDVWQLVVSNEQERVKRHQAILEALHDFLITPNGAMTTSLLPHLTGLEGVIAVKTEAGRAPLFSPLVSNFMEQLNGFANGDCLIYPFHSVGEFSKHMYALAANSYPCLPRLNSFAARK